MKVTRKVLKNHNVEATEAKERKERRNQNK